MASKLSPSEPPSRLADAIRKLTQKKKESTSRAGNAGTRVQSNAYPTKTLEGKKTY